jgi:hypothetical protein
MNKIITLSICFLFIFSSCGSKIESAKESLLGNWQVKEIYKYTPSSGISEEDKSGLGTYEFTNLQCDYNFTFESINETNSFEYDFQASKENAGFTKEDRFDIVGEENYRVRFGDETSDAHEGATEITLERTVESDSLTFEIIIHLEKK